ncbi:siderophore-interacting protein [Gordonia humi]|uniref:NADPH-dependent ferric siderophore reductase n=1 Tax=Gordonia humi TaxID=686429 RepID=A0A840F3M9_9ACTN|nr:siderophore-interacting protein [Gordonia humi]MBB4136039.1 NADPH-dependent ferric siderophore reductase [Gordonia humi]
MAKRQNTMTVLRTEDLTGHIRRIWLGGEGFDDFQATEHTDMYVKIQFAVPDRDEPVLRTYTVRTYDQQARELAIDFVVHGDEGVAGPWAARVQPGESVTFLGPGSKYRPDPAAPWHLIVGDEAGLPAVAAAVEALPADAIAKVFIEVAGPEDEIDIAAPAGAEITWVHRGYSSFEAPDEAAGDNAPIIAAVKSAEWLDGEPHVFIHGEAQAVMKNLRPYVRKERGVSAERAGSISGYWRRGRTEDGFRAWKAEQVAINQADEEKWSKV